MSYIIAFYDISDNSRRFIAAEKLRGLGFQRVQRSVYIARGGSSLAKEAFRALMRIVDRATDSVIVVVVPREYIEKALAFGSDVKIGEGVSEVL